MYIHPDTVYKHPLSFKKGKNMKDKILSVCLCCIMKIKIRYFISNIHSLVTMWNISLAAKGAIAHRLQGRTACLIQYGRRGL